MATRKVRRSSSYDEGKFREAVSMTCSFFQVEEMYPDQEKALRACLKEMIFSSARTQSHTQSENPSSDLKSVYKTGKNEQLYLVLENNTRCKADINDQKGRNDKTENNRSHLK